MASQPQAGAQASQAKSQLAKALEEILPYVSSALKGVASKVETDK